MQNASLKKGKNPPSWSKRHRSTLQVASIGLGVIALVALLFSAQDEDMIPFLMGFSLLVAGLIAVLWTD